MSTRYRDINTIPMYRCDMTDSNREAWRRQSAIGLHCQTLCQRYVEYWSATIAVNANDPKALWSKVSKHCNAIIKSVVAVACKYVGKCRHHFTKVRCSCKRKGSSRLTSVKNNNTQLSDHDNLKTTDQQCQ